MAQHLQASIAGNGTTSVSRPLPLSVGQASIWFSVYLSLGGILILLQRESGPSFWYPPIALGMLLMYCYGWRAAPIVLLADFIISWLQYQQGAAIGFVVAANTTLEVSLSAALLSVTRVDIRLIRATDLFALFAAGIIAPTFVGASHGSLWLLILDIITVDKVLHGWLTWWLGDAVTAMCLLPALLIWLAPRLGLYTDQVRHNLQSLIAYEGALLLMVTLGLCVIAFGRGENNLVHTATAHGVVYLCFLPAIWSAIRFGVRATVTLVALMSMLAVVVTLLSGTPASLVDIQQAPIVLDIQFFMFTLALGGTALAIALEGERAATAASRRNTIALAANESRLRQILDEMPVLLEAFDAQGNIVVWNREAERVTGYRAAEIVGNPDAVKLLYPDPIYRKTMLDTWRLHGNDYRNWEWRLTHRDGSMRIISWSNIAARVPIDGWLAWEIGVDITAQRQAESDLRASEIRFRQLAENIREVFWMRDLQTQKILYVSPAYETIWGHSCQSLYEHPESFMDSVHPDDRERVAAAVQQRAQVGFAEEYRILRPDREVRWVRAQTYPVLDETGQIYRLVGVAEDITDRREIDEQLQATQALLTAVIEYVPASLFVTDLVGHFLLVNPAWEQFFGQTRATVVGKMIEEIFPSPVAQVFRATNQDIITNNAAITSERTLRNISGKEHAFQVIKFPVRNEYSQLTGVGGIAFDITEQRRLEAQFRQAQKMEAVGRLAGGVAHDFNNLLSVINGYSDLILEGCADSQSALRQDITIIREAGERATTLTRQLLAFSRQQVLQPETLDLNRIITDIQKMLRRLIGEDIVLTTQLAADLQPVWADRGQLEQVLMNLAVNARDAMPQGGSLLFLTTNLYPQEAADTLGSWVRLEVRDNGIGMSTDTLAHLFEPFFTTKEIGHGTGLGLATVHGIVTQSGGTIQVVSALGKGTSFIIDLPAAAVATAATESPGLRNALHGLETILVVEDEAQIRTLIVRVLRAQGYTILEAADGVMALDIANQYPASIDLLLTDIVMPGMSGRHLAAELILRRPTLTILFMSGYPDRVASEITPPVLMKPFTPTMLCQAVRAACDAVGQIR